MVQIISTGRTMMVLNAMTSRRAVVVAQRTGSEVAGLLKAQMIDLLKAKLQTGVAHFLYLKKDGSVREAWGTTSRNLMKASINGNGIPRDYVNCVAYWDVEKSGFRSLRFENIVRVF